MIHVEPRMYKLTPPHTNDVGSVQEHTHGHEQILLSAGAHTPHASCFAHGIKSGMRQVLVNPQIPHWCNTGVHALDRGRLDDAVVGQDVRLDAAISLALRPCLPATCRT